MKNSTINGKFVASFPLASSVGVTLSKNYIILNVGFTKYIQKHIWRKITDLPDRWSKKWNYLLLSWMTTCSKVFGERGLPVLRKGGSREAWSCSRSVLYPAVPPKTNIPLLGEARRYCRVPSVLQMFQLFFQTLFSQVYMKSRLLKTHFFTFKVLTL